MGKMGISPRMKRMNLRRRATIYVVIGTLLLCPYTCLGRAAAAAESLDCACNSPHDDCCDCCSPTPASHSGQNRPSDSSRQGGNCLCHGAVLQSPAIVPGVDAGPMMFVTAADLPIATQSSIFVDGLFAVERSACHFAAADSGRAVRALISSFLL